MSRVTALALFAAAAPLACGLNQEGVPPRSDTLFYPASAVTDPSGDWLFVANSNADLRYNDGTVVTLDLAAAKADREDPNWADCLVGDYVKTPRSLGANPHECCRDQLDSNILNCDERAYIQPNSTIRIGSFAAGMIVQSAECPPADKDTTCGCDPVADPLAPDARHPRLFIAVRGNTSLTWADILPEVPPRLVCASGAGNGVTECDADHRVIATERGTSASFATERGTTRLPDEPYSMAIDQYAGLLYLGHLSGNAALPYTGGFSLIDVGPDHTVFLTPRFIGPFPSPFPGNSNGSVGITSLLWRPDAAGGSTVYATSRFVPQVAGLQTLPVACDGGVRDFPAFPTGDNFDTMLVGGETRGVQFAGRDSHAFVLQRSPPALVEFDGHNPIAIVETCSSPTFLYKHDAGRGERLFVNCFDTGEVYVFDPTAPHLERSFQIGRGPAGLVFPDNAPTIAYVVGFGDNNISVVDLDPSSRTEYRVVQRLGFPSTVPR